MVCDECRVAGYFELLPGDDPITWSAEFRSAVLGRLAAGGSPIDDMAVDFPESYPGHHTDSGTSLCRMAVGVVEAEAGGDNNAVPRWAGWAAFNSGCEAGLRANLLGTPTLVWGPGSLAQAHAVDEFVPFDQVRAVARQFVRLARLWGERDLEGSG